MPGTNLRVGTVLRSSWHAYAPMLATVLIAALWMAQALTSPTSTYHLLPVLGAAAWPVAARLVVGPATW